MRNAINRESELRALLEELNLDGMAALATSLALKAAKENLSHEAYLFELARQEREQRVARRTARLLRQSGLPVGKTFLTFEAKTLPPALQLQLDRLKSGAFLEAAVNVIAVGKPGVGKVMLWLRLGMSWSWPVILSSGVVLPRSCNDCWLPSEICTCPRNWRSSTSLIVSSWMISAMSSTIVMKWRCFLPFWHSDQHTPEVSHSQSQFIQVTAPHHPLQGQVFPLVRTLTKQGEIYVVLQLPSGATQQMPARWTDQCPTLPTSPVVPLWSVSSVRELLDILKQLQDRPHHEEVSNGSSPTHVAHVFSHSSTRTDRATGRPTASSSSRATPRRNP